MTGKLGLLMRGLALAGTALALGCAHSVKYEGTTSGTGGSGAAGGSGATGGTATGGGDTGGTTTTTTACVKKDDCAYLTSACVVGTCINGTCMTTPANDGASCDDGKFCTTGDTCTGGMCVGGSMMPCAGDDPCHIGQCDELTHSCIQVPGNDGAQCDDMDPCTYFGTCSSGTCQKGGPIDCSFLDSTCGVGVCDPAKGCISAPMNDGSPCEDGLFCTAGDTCQGGVCTGGKDPPCAPPGGCFIAMCDEINQTCSAMPGNDGAPCDDGSPCTDQTTCMGGQCIGGVPANDGAMCQGAASCVVGQTCLAGKCQGGVGPTVYFADDFKDNSKGWILGPEWQIGPAKASMPLEGNPDPDMDHTPTADNGVAGVEIGGNADTVVHPYYYMESPAFDTSAAQGPVILGFYRWLNSDYDPYMHNSVDVYDGSKWVNLWTSGPAPAIFDAAWTFEQYDLTAYKSAQMKVRFGFDIGSGGVFTVGSWNIDDVLVAAAACP
jgi:hypothetical protein